MTIHFIAGLPRAGKTMLAAILRQNPAFFHFGMESPVCDMVMAMEKASSCNNELTWVLNAPQKRRLRKYIFDAVYAEHLDKGTVVWDTCRFWTAKMPLLATLFPDFKMICCVRPIAQIMDSFERLYQRNAGDSLSGIYNFDPASTVFTRCAQLAAGDGIVGRALNALREAYYGEFSDHMLFVDYQSLCENPSEAILRIYNFVGEPNFLHSFDRLKASNYLFDQRLGAPGLHNVRPVVEQACRKVILPPMLYNSYLGDDFWTHEGCLTQTENSNVAQN